MTTTRTEMLDQISECLDEDGRWQTVWTDWFDGGWHDRALCRESDSVIFFGDVDEKTGFFRYPLSLRAEALMVCSNCPVLTSCLKDEMDIVAARHIEARGRGMEKPKGDSVIMPFGIRGGLLAPERILLRDGPAELTTCTRCNNVRVIQPGESHKPKACPCSSKDYKHDTDDGEQQGR